jgi:hypothetical protein
LSAGSRLPDLASLIRSLRLGLLALFAVVAGSCLFTTSASGQDPEPPEPHPVFVCLTACHNGFEKMAEFCFNNTSGGTLLLCLAAAHGGNLACEKFCHKYFGPRPRPHGPSVPQCSPDQKLCGNSCIPAGDVCPQCPPNQKNCGTACIPAAMTCCQDSGCPPNADCCARSCLYPGNLCCGNNRICGPNSECCISFGSMGCMPSGYVCCGATRENGFPTSCPAGSTCRHGGCDPS